jgi:hypothetical protein
MKAVSFFLALSLFSTHCLAQAFEGTINGKLDVWFDLAMPSSDGPVSGSYFYIKVGEDIQVSGVKKGNSLSLNEYGDGEKITGVINCIMRKDSITGTWKKPKGKTALPVALIRANPAFGKYEKMLNGKDLRLLDGTVLSEELNSYSGEGYLDENENPTKSTPALDATYENDDILSVSFSWAYMGAYPSYGTVYHTFDLKTNSELSLWDQIDNGKMDEFNSLLCQQIQPKLDETRESYPDSEWQDVLAPLEDSEDPESAIDSIGEYFHCTDVRKASPHSGIQKGINYFLDSTSLHFVLDNFFEFPHVIQAMDLFGEASIPLDDFKKYLKKESPLRRISAGTNHK